ncbi:hypothetical protein DWG18_02495 [Lysobacter sp. TY2-98]|nr:hypothetical protein DWG18_02495 [Lysobacter sp. TY2-98]
MLVGWRMGDDLESLANLPDGRLEIDVLRGHATHSSGAEPHLFIAHELQAWFSARLEQLSIPIAAISKAIVEADIRTDLLATNRKRVVSFNFDVNSLVTTAEREYRGRLAETHSWHSRVGAL